MKKYTILSIMLIIFLLTRLIILLTCFEESFTCEERHQGMIAKEIIEGLDLPLFEYQHSSYGGGTLLEGIATVPFFLIFGKNLFALKLTPLLFSTATLIVFFLFAYKYFNKRTAIIMSLLFTFASPIWINNTLNSQGLHTENIFFTVTALFLFYEVIFNQKSSLIYYFCLGLVSGLGTYWAYTFLATLAAIFIIWLAHDAKMFLRRGFYLFCIGFLVGMIPWFIYNLGSRFNGFGVLSDFFSSDYSSGGTLIGIPLRFLKGLWFARMLQLVSFHEFPYKFLNYLYIVIYWAGFFFILQSYRYSLKKIILARESFLIIFPPLLIMSCVLYQVEFQDSFWFMYWRYMVGIFPCVFLTTAIILDRFILKFRFLKLLFSSIFLFFIILAAAKFRTRIDFKDFGMALKCPGYTYQILLTSFMDKYHYSLYKIVDNITRLKPSVRYEVLTQEFSWSHYLSDDPVPVDFGEYVKLSQRLEERYKPVFYKMLIKSLYHHSKLNLKDLVREVDALSSQVDEAYRPYFYESVGAIVVDCYFDDMAKYKEGALLIGKKYRPYYYKGLADFYFPDTVVETTKEYLARYRSCMEWIPEEGRPFYLRGVGESLSKVAVSRIMERPNLIYADEDDDAGLLYSFIFTLEPGNKRYVLEGIGNNLSYFYSSNNERAAYQFINNLKIEGDRIFVRKIMLENLNK